MKWPDRRWPLFALLPVLAFGVFAGALMTWHHEVQAYGGAEAHGKLIGCEESATVNCDVVNTSEWSELFGVPLATFGAATWLTLAVVAVLALRGRRDAVSFLVLAGLGSTALSGWLFYFSKVQLGFVCAWCLRMYAVTVATLVLSLLAGRPARPEVSTLLTALAIGAGVFGLSVAAQKLYRHSLLGAGTVALEHRAASQTSDDGVKLEAKVFDVLTEDKHEAKLPLGPNDAWKGNPQAKVTLVEFGDFECGYCKRAAGELKRLAESYGDRVLFVFKHFPMDSACNPVATFRKHPFACNGAQAATCAGEQKKFWPFHDLTFKNNHQLGYPALRTYAEQVGLDLSKYDACMADQHTLEGIRADGTLGGALDIHGTPRIYINGKVYHGGTSAEAVARVLEAALGQTGVDALARAKSMHVTEDVGVIPADVPAVRNVSLGGLSFSIDTFEAALEDGKAVSGKHRIPATRMSWYGARDACAAVGRRLCTEQEWVSACQGALAVDDNRNGAFADDMIEGTAYPYGDYHDKERCWDDKTGEGFRPVYTGEMPGCATDAGVYDLVGNVEEWAGDRPEHAVLLGGAFDTKEDHARCYRRNESFGAGYANPRTGFRCCGAVSP